MWRWGIYGTLHACVHMEAAWWVQRVLRVGVWGCLESAGALGAGFGYLEEELWRYELVLSSSEGSLRDVLRSCSDELIIKYL